MPDHRNQYRTILGSFLSIVTFMLVLGYAGYKFTDLVEFNDYKLMKVEQENYYGMRDPFGSKHGFMIAASVSRYDGDTEPIEDDEIGTVKLIKKTWDADDINSGGALTFKEIPTRPCTYEDFHGEDPLFYDTKETSIGDLSIHWRKFKCIKEGHEFELFGNYDTQAASNLMIIFDLCNASERKCKKPEEIKEWM